ncbi:MAG: class I SAM-dependent methyltransferase [bacterium]
MSHELYDRTYFLEACGGHELYKETHGGLLDERLFIVFRLADMGSPMRVMDLGCGRGELLRHAVEAGALAFGVDPSKEAIEISKETLFRSSVGGIIPRAGLCRAEGSSLPFSSSVFHRVILSDILEHLTKNQLRKTLAEVHRVLRSDGMVVFHTFPNKWFYNLFYPMKRLFWDRLTGQAGPRNPRTHYERLLHLQELSPWSIWRNFKPWFRIRLWCSHRSRWDDNTKGFKPRGGPLALLREPELWGVAWKK